MKKPDEAVALAEQFRKLIDVDQVVELRAVKFKNGSGYECTMGGYFDGQHLTEMAQAALSVSPNAMGTYFTMNPVNRALLARRWNRIDRSKEGELTTDKDTVSRQWLLADADPIRPSHISATDTEKEKAHQVALNTRDYLRGRGWPDPMLNDSGNGYHLMYRIDLPTDDGGLVKDILWILGDRLDTPEVKIDQSVFNPSRICKLPGTWSRKGDSPPDRPHRKSAILECPDPVKTVPRELLESLAAESRDEQRKLKEKEEAERKKTQPANGTAKTGDYPFLQVENWLRDRGVGFRVKSGKDDKGRTVYILDKCPFDSSHGDHSSVTQESSGKPGFHCFHDHCGGNHWAQFCGKIGKPERKHYDPSTLSAEKSAPPSNNGTHASPTSPDESKATRVPQGERSWPVLGKDALIGPAGELVHCIEPHTEADPNAILFQTLIGFGNIIGRTAFFPHEADRHYANEYLVLVGQTAAGRKGTSWGHARRALETADPDWASYRIAGGLSSGEGLVHSVRDRHKDDEGVADKRQLVVENEFAQVLKVIERPGNTLSPILRQAWESVALGGMTKTTPTRCACPHISLIGHITADELQRYLTATEIGNGLGNRHLFVCVKRSKLLPDGGYPNQDDLTACGRQISIAVESARRLTSVLRGDDARQVWHEVYPRLNEERPGLVGSLSARCLAHICRLSLIYALLDEQPIIGARHLRAAVACWDYCEASLRYIFGSSLGDPVADQIRDALRDAPGGMSRTELRDFFGRNRTTEQIGRALSVLQRWKMAEPRFDPTKTRGRPSERWFSTES